MRVRALTSSAPRSPLLFKVDAETLEWPVHCFSGLSIIFSHVCVCGHARTHARTCVHTCVVYACTCFVPCSSYTLQLYVAVNLNCVYELRVMCLERGYTGQGRDLERRI